MKIAEEKDAVVGSSGGHPRGFECESLWKLAFT